MSANGKKALVHAFSVALATLIENLLMELIDRISDWARNYGRKQPEPPPDKR